MPLQPQPPPHSNESLPAGGAVIHRKKKWRWILLVLLSSLAGLILFAPLMCRSRKNVPQTQAMSKARQIGLAMFEFETEFGKFPDPSTAAKVKSNTDTTLVLGTKTSNDFFRQLIASGIAQSEQIFYSETSASRRPDGVITGTKALEKGECSFTYFLGATMSGNPKRPLVVVPMIPGTDRFDPKPYEGKAVILRLDNSVSYYPIDTDGHVIVGGRNLMDPQHPIWDGHAPVIAWPDF